MCHICKSSQKWSQRLKPKRDIFIGTKKLQKKLQRLKPKRNIFPGTKTIWLKYGCKRNMNLTVHNLHEFEVDINFKILNMKRWIMLYDI